MTTAPPPAALQLYTLREQASADFMGVLSDVAAMGYVGVEPAGLHGHPASQVRKALDDLGLEVASTHGPLPDTEEAAAGMDDHAALGSRELYVSLGREWFASPEQVSRAADRMVSGAEAASKSDVRLGYHNHWWEFARQPDGRSLYHTFLAALAERGLDTPLEVDLYWVKVGGVDPAALLAELGPAVTHVHVKDGPATVDDPMVAVGQGVMDIPGVLAAGKHLRWHIVELDRCATDIAEAARQSVAYLAEHGLSRVRA